MKLLIDTHVFLWWYGEPPKLPASVRSALLDPHNEVFVSAAVVWEIAIKRMQGRLGFQGEVAKVIAAEGFTALPIEVAHAEEVGRLALHHRDPFDRILVAQARIEKMVLVSTAPAMVLYDGFDLLPAPAPPTTTG